MRTKQALGPGQTLFVGYANDLSGYVPSKWAKVQGGYGPVESSCWFHSLITSSGYDADNVLVEEAVALARSAR